MSGKPNQDEIIIDAILNSGISPVVGGYVASIPPEIESALKEFFREHGFVVGREKFEYTIRELENARAEFWSRKRFEGKNTKGRNAENKNTEGAAVDEITKLLPYAKKLLPFLDKMLYPSVVITSKAVGDNIKKRPLPCMVGDTSLAAALIRDYASRWWPGGRHFEAIETVQQGIEGLIACFESAIEDYTAATSARSAGRPKGTTKQSVYYLALALAEIYHTATGERRTALYHGKTRSEKGKLTKFGKFCEISKVKGVSMTSIRLCLERWKDLSAK
jgi:hypothetical protein